MYCSNIRALGYFGKPHTSVARLKSVVRAYSLDQFMELDALLTSRGLMPEVRAVLQAVLHSQRMDGSQGSKGGTDQNASAILRGFMVLFDRHRVTLSLYVKAKGETPRSLTTVIPGLARMRQKRLH